MSGSTIGGIVGGVIGFFVGAPQAGYFIGSLVGGALDPQKIKAPSIGDAQQQTSQAGVPIPKLYGKPAPIKCNIIDGEQKARKIKREVEQGKGGPTVEEERFLLTTAFGIGEGPLVGIQRVRRNGEVIIDNTPETGWPAYADGSPLDRLRYIREMQAKTAAWKGKIRFYMGTEDQAPDPALEAIHGVGNTPSFRGLAYMVVVDDDVTQTGGAASIWEVEVVADGVVIDETVETRAVPEYGRFSDAHWPLLDNKETDYTYDVRVTAVNGVVTSGIFDTIAEAIEFASSVNPVVGGAGTNILGRPDKYVGYWANSYGAYSSSEAGANVLDFLFQEMPSVIDYEAITLIYQYSLADTYIAKSSQQTTRADLAGYSLVGNILGEHMRSDNPGANTGWTSYLGADGQGVWARYPVLIRTTPKRIKPTQLWTPLPDVPGYAIDRDGNLVKIPDETLSMAPSTAPYARVLSMESFGGDTYSRVYLWRDEGPLKLPTDEGYDDQTFWDAAYSDAVSRGLLPGGWTYNPLGGASHYPQPAPSYSYYDTTVERESVSSVGISLRTVVEDIAINRGILPAERIDAVALTEDILPGFTLASGGNTADAIRVFQQPFVFDTPEVDGQIVCVKRGGAVAITITDDDLLELGDEDARAVAQEVEYPRKVHLIVPDPDAAYTLTPQTAERYTPDVRATGEESIPLPIPFTADPAKQIAEVMLKVAWARAEGTIELPLPEEFSRFVPSDCFSYMGKRWIIEESTYNDGEVRWRAVYDRQSAYSSNAAGVPATPPVLPGSGIQGPTILRVLNVPQLRDDDDRIGFYVAAGGMFTGWNGATIQGKLPEDSEWRALGAVVAPSIMGQILTQLPTANPYLIDEESSIEVEVSGVLESITSEQLLNEFNQAVIGDSPNQEVIQFQNADPSSSDGIYTLSRLPRGRLDTVARRANIGTSFVLLNAAVFLEAPASWLNRTIYLRAVTRGTDPDANATIEFEWRPPETMTEWTPFQFIGTRDSSNNIRISWNGRGRLGTNARAFQSQFFDGYRITIQKGAASVVYQTREQFFSYPAVLQTADFGSATGTLTANVQALNRITGASSPLIGSIT